MPPFVYDHVPYSNFPYAQTHPDRLATVATLHGLEPPNPFTARRAGDRLQRRREPAGDGRGDARHPGLGVDLLRRWPSRRAADHRRGRPRERRIAPGRRPCTDRRFDRHVRLHRRPRRLRLGARPTPARRCWRRSAPRCAGRHRLRLLQRRSPAATSGACCATWGCGMRGTSEGRRRRPRRRRSCTCSSRSTASPRRYLRRAPRARGARPLRRPAVPARARRSQRVLAPGVVRGVRRARAAPRAALCR